MPNNATYNIPSFAREQAYAFVAPDPEIQDIYQELSAISEEIISCRSKILENA